MVCCVGSCGAPAALSVRFRGPDSPEYLYCARHDGRQAAADRREFARFGHRSIERPRPRGWDHDYDHNVIVTEL